MNKTLEVFLTVLALAGLYCAVPKGAATPLNSSMQVEQSVVVADGPDPMPLCRRAHCTP